jgi:hypothetical protein
MTPRDICERLQEVRAFTFDGRDGNRARKSLELIEAEITAQRARTYRLHETCTTYIRVGGGSSRWTRKGSCMSRPHCWRRASAEELADLAKDAERVGEGE